MSFAGHMNIGLPAPFVLCSCSFFNENLDTYLHDDLAEGGAVGGDVEEDPDGGHCALDWVDPSGLERGR